MRGISEKQLEDARNNAKLNWDARRAIDIVLYLISLSELQEPWMTLDEFLKSGFIGVCFVFTEPYTILCERTNCGFFAYNSNLVDISAITHVMPIHKPESPK